MLSVEKLKSITNYKFQITKTICVLSVLLISNIIEMADVKSKLKQGDLFEDSSSDEESVE